MAKDKARTSSSVAIIDRWLPTLCFLDALSFATMFVPLVLFKRLGLGNDETAFCASLLFTPWLLLPLMERFALPLRRLRFIVIGLEALQSVLFVVMAFALRDGVPPSTLTVLLWVAALCGALHSVAVKRMSQRRAAHVGHVMLIFMLALTLCQGLVVAFAGNMEVITRTIRGSWSMAFCAVAAIFGLAALLHCALLRNAREETCPAVRLALDRGDFTMVLLYTLLLIPAGLVTPVGQLFLFDARHNGGLGLSPAEFALSQGTIGIVAVVVGGMAASLIARRGNTERWQWPATVALAFPSALYIYMSHTMTDSLLVVSLCVFVHQLMDGLAFGVCFSSLAGRFGGNALRFAVMALPMIVCGMVSGAFQESMGYRTFFIVMLAFSPFVFVVMAIIRSINAVR